MLYSFDQCQLKEAPFVTVSDEVTDEQLMERIQQGDEAALASLYHRHQALLRTIIGRMIDNDEDVDDILQEHLLELWRQAVNYRVERGRPLGWIITLARRRTIDRIRRKAAYMRARNRFSDEVAIQGEMTQHGADEEVAQSDRARALGQLIAQLPEAQQQAVKLAFYRSMSQRQIAAHTGIPLGTIKTRLELALRKLRNAVLAFGELHDGIHSAPAA